MTEQFLKVHHNEFVRDERSLCNLALAVQLLWVVCRKGLERLVWVKPMRDTDSPCRSRGPGHSSVAVNENVVSVGAPLDCLLDVPNGWATVNSQGNIIKGDDLVVIVVEVADLIPLRADSKDRLKVLTKPLCLVDVSDRDW